MKKIIVYGFLMFLFAAPCPYAAAQESNPDKKVLREQRREERRQKREERKQERQKEEAQEELTPATQNVPKNAKSESITIIQPTQQNQIQQKAPIKKEETPVHKAPATINSSQVPQSIKGAIEQSVPNTASELEKVSQSSSENNISSFVGFFVFAVLGIWILSKIFTRKCSHCKKYRAMVPIEETYLGRVKTERVKDNQGNISLVHYNRIQVTRQCKYCGYQDRVIKTVKGDRE